MKMKETVQFAVCSLLGYAETGLLCGRLVTGIFDTDPDGPQVLNIFCKPAVILTKLITRNKGSDTLNRCTQRMKVLPKGGELKRKKEGERERERESC